MSAGDETDLHLPAGRRRRCRRGRRGRRSRSAAVKEQELPELDDDFAQTASEFDTVDELTADVRTRLERGKRLEQAAAARDAVLEKLLDQAEVPLPEGVVDRGARRPAARRSSSSSATPA